MMPIFIFSDTKVGKICIAIPYPESKKNYWTEKYIDNFDLLKQKLVQVHNHFLMLDIFTLQIGGDCSYIYK